MGLDPEEHIRFRTLLTSLASPRTVLLTTHIVEDVGSPVAGTAQESTLEDSYFALLRRTVQTHGQRAG